MLLSYALSTISFLRWGTCSILSCREAILHLWLSLLSFFVLFSFHCNFFKLRWPELLAIFSYRFNPISCISQQLVSHLTCVRILNWKVVIWWLTVPLTTHLYQLSANRCININKTMPRIAVLQVKIKWPEICWRICIGV